MKASVPSFMSIGLLSLLVTSVVHGQEVAARKPQRAAPDEKVVQRLVDENQRIAETLGSLTKEQKNSVVALLTISRATAAVESVPGSFGHSALHAYYASLNRLSPAYKAPAKFQSLSGACRNESIGCASAASACEKKKKPSECDRDPDVNEACSAELVCMMGALQKLIDGLPGIRQGHDPWPPQPFPY